MLHSIRQFFETHLRGGAEGDEQTASCEHSLHLATAALLIETSRANFQVRPEELEAAARALEQTFSDLTHGETRELVRLAEAEADEAVSLFQFTSLIDREFPPQRKVHLIEMLWRVAYADGRKDAHEEHLIRKIADLLHVSHSDFVRTRHRVEATLAGSTPP
jgi:uncharacterized tellurite resistance protein B-like protein